jgi:hypothetical protein
MFMIRNEMLEIIFLFLNITQFIDNYKLFIYIYLYNNIRMSTAMSVTPKDLMK